MARLAGMTPGQIAQKQVNAVNAAANAYMQGINSVQRAPGEMAAANKAGYLQGVQSAVDKWAAKVAAVTLVEWKDAAIKKGAARLGQGVTAAQKKINDFWTRWYPILQGAQQQVRGMPKTTFQERLARMTQMASLLHQQAQAPRP